MQCCVPFCVNTTDNASTSERTGITFHELPIKESLRGAWLKALGKQDHNLHKPAVVCSQHFLDEDFVKVEGFVRQIRADAIPSTLQMCMMCLDTDSKLLLMSKHKLEETYEQLTGLSLFQLCRGANLRPTLCVLCAQRLINFRRFRELTWRVHSLMTELLERYGLITVQHKELMKCRTKHLKFNLTTTTLGTDCWDSYIHLTNEKTAAEGAAVGDVTVVVKNEDISDSMLSTTKRELISEDDNALDNINNCVPGDEYSDLSIKLEEPIPAASCAAAAQHVVKTESFIKVESVNFQCTVCYEDIADDNYNEHMSMHLQNAAGDAACGAAVSYSWDSLVLDNNAGSRKLNDDTPLYTDFRQGLVPLSTGLAVHNENKVQATVEAGVIQKSEKANIGELDNYSSESCTKQHTEISTVEKIYTCEMCNYKCAVKSNMLRHKKTHTGEKPYTCEICNYKCAVKNYLLQHMKTHAGQKPHTCEICNYKCSLKGNLLRHMKTHTGEKSYTCQICNYKFSQKGNLLNHMTVHTGEKPYNCEICNHKFSRKGNLLNHVKIHTGEKPYTCEICNYKFSQKGNLLNHMRIHTGERS